MNAILPYAAIDKKMSTALAKMAIRALYLEVKAYPKPGLVSFIDAGAHHDMNGETFYRSLFGLRHFFQQIAKLSLVEFSFESLKKLAIEAEFTMLEKTQGINTHRGAIFALGIICVSVARLSRKKESFTPIELRTQIVNDWQMPLAYHQSNSLSHGALVRKVYHIVDAKQMAMEGYNVLFQLLPSFIALYTETQSLDITCLYAYLEILLKIDDTNILYRKGEEGLNYAKTHARELLAITCFKKRQMHALTIHHQFSQRGISPGGVADLVAVLLFLGQIFCERLRCHC